MTAIKKFIIGALLTIAGVALAAALGKPMLDNAKASTDWPSVSGTIIESGVDIKKRRTGKPGRRRNKRTYKAHIVYEYSVDGQSYESETLWYGLINSTKSASNKLVRQYPVDKTVEVFYRPDNPNDAVLVPGVHFSSYVIVVAGIVIALIGLLLLTAPVFTAFMVGKSMTENQFTNHPHGQPATTPEASYDAVTLNPTAKSRSSLKDTDEDGFQI